MQGITKLKECFAITLAIILLVSIVFSGYSVSYTNEVNENSHKEGESDITDETRASYSKEGLYNTANLGNYKFHTSEGFHSEKNVLTQDGQRSFSNPHRIDRVNDMGYSGDGVKVAIADTGVDFGHPDLNNNYAVVDDESSPYHGWPIAYDPMSMNAFLSDGSPKDTWYVDTSTTGYGPFELPHTIKMDGLNDFLSEELTGQSGGDGVGDWDVNRLYTAVDEDDWFFGFNTYYGSVNKTYTFYIDEDGPGSGGFTDPRENYVDFESSHSGTINSIVHNPDNDRIFTATRGVPAVKDPEDRNSIRVWGEDGTLIETLKSHGSQVLSLDVSPDGERLISLDQTNAIIWDTATLEEVTTFEYSSVSGSIKDIVSFSPNSTYIAIGGIGESSNDVRIYDTTGNLIKSINVGGPRDLEFNPVEGELLAVGYADGDSKVWNITTESVVVTSPESHGADTKLTWMSDGRHLLTVGTSGVDNDVYMWDTETQTLQHSYELSSQAFIEEENMNSGNLLMGEPDFSNTTSNDGNYRGIEEAGDHNLLDVTYTLPFDEKPVDDFSLNSRMAWYNDGGENCYMDIYNHDTQEWDDAYEFRIPDGTFVSPSGVFDPDIYSDDEGNVMIKFRDANTTSAYTGQLAIDSLFFSYDININSLASSDSGERILASTGTGEIHILNKTLDKQDFINNPKGYESELLAFADDDDTILSATDDCSLRKWDANTKDYTAFYQNKPDYVIYADYVRKIDDETGDLFRDPEVFEWNKSSGEWDGPMSLSINGGTVAYESQEESGDVIDGFAEIQVPRDIFGGVDSIAVQMALMKTEEPSRAIDATPKEFNLAELYYEIHGNDEAGRDYALEDTTSSTLSNLRRVEMPTVEVDESIGPGPYHFGTHTSEILQDRLGGEVGVVVYEGNVYVDLDHDYVIDDSDAVMNKEHPIGTVDLDGDGIADLSAGMLYFVSDAKEVEGEELIIEDKQENLAELEHDNLVSFPNRVVVYKNGDVWDEVTKTSILNASTQTKLVPNIDEDDLTLVGENMPVANQTVFQSVTGEEEGFDLPHGSVYSAGELIEDYTIHDVSLFRPPEMDKVPEENYTVDYDTGEITFSDHFLADYPRDLVLNAYYSFTGELKETDYSYDSSDGTIDFTHSLNPNSTVTATYTFQPWVVDEEEGNITITGDYTSDDEFRVDYQYDGKPLPYSEVLAEERDMEFIPTAGKNDMIALIGDFGWDSIEDEAKTHGTRIASSIVSSGSLTPDIQAAAPNATIIPIANADSDLENSWKFATQGYDGVKNSGDECQIVYTAPKLTTYETGLDTLSQKLNDISKSSPSTLFITGIGDDGYGYGTALSPTASNALVVGASTYSIDSEGEMRFMQIPSYSSRGPTSSGKVKPDLIAIGTGHVYLPLGVRGTDGSKSFTARTWSSTELSAGVVTGIAALVYDSYNDTYGDFPQGDDARQFMLSSSKDMGYDIFTQGHGFIDALDSIKLSTGSSGLLISDSVWEPGDYHGEVYSSFPNFVEPGETYTKDINITNLGNPEEVSIFSNIFNKVGEDSWSFDVSTSNPDYTTDITDMIPYDSSLVRVTVSGDTRSRGSDSDPNVLTINDWYDEDGSGTIDSGELSTINECRLASSTLQVSLSDPLIEVKDGVVIEMKTGVTNPYEYEILVEYFAYSEMEWLSMNGVDNIADEERLNLSLEIPEDTPPGTYDGSVVVNHDLTTQPETELVSYKKYDIKHNVSVNESHDSDIQTVWNEPVEMIEGNTDGKLSHGNLTWVQYDNITHVIEELTMNSEIFSTSNATYPYAYWLNYNESYGSRFDGVNVSRILAHNTTDESNDFEYYPQYSQFVDINETTGWIYLTYDAKNASGGTCDSLLTNYTVVFDHGNISYDPTGTFSLENPVPTNSTMFFNYSYLPDGKFTLDHRNIIEDSFTFYLNNKKVPESNYTLDDANGTVYLTSPFIEMPPGSQIDFDYTFTYYEPHDSDIQTGNEFIYFESGNMTGNLPHGNLTWVSAGNITHVIEELTMNSEIFSTSNATYPYAYWLNYNESYGSRFDGVNVSRILAHNTTDESNDFEYYPQYSQFVDINETTGWIYLTYDAKNASGGTCDSLLTNYTVVFDHDVSFMGPTSEFSLQDPVPSDSKIIINYAYLPSGKFILANDKIVEENFTFYLNHQVVPEDNYTVDWENGTVSLTSPFIEISPGSKIDFDYSYVSEYEQIDEVEIPDSIYHPRYYKEGTLTVYKDTWDGTKVALSSGEYTFDRYNSTIKLSQTLLPDESISVSFDYYNRSRVIPIVAHISAYGSRHKFTNPDMNTPFLTGGFMGGNGGDTIKSGDWRYYYLDIPEQGKYKSPPESLKFMVDGDWSEKITEPPRTIENTEKATDADNLLVEDGNHALIEGDGYIEVSKFDDIPGSMTPHGDIRNIRIGVRYKADSPVIETKKQDMMKLSFTIDGEDFDDKLLEVVPTESYQVQYLDITNELVEPKNVNELEVKIEHDQFATHDGWDLMVEHIWLDITKSKRPTDMDIHILSNTRSAVENEAPYTIGHQIGSDEDDEFLTNTMESQEILAMTLNPGLNVIAVHNTILNGTTKENVDVQTSTLELSSTKLEHYTNHLSGNAEIGMTWNTERLGYGGSVVGPGDEEHLPDQEVLDDDTSGITTYESWNRAMIERSSYNKLVTLENALSWDVHVQGHDNVPDLDLGLVYDANGDGEPQFEELITPDLCDYESYSDYGTGEYATCADADADERVKLYNPPDGDYIICVYGWTVQGDSGNFDFSMTTILAGVKGYETQGYHPDLMDDEPGQYLTHRYSTAYEQNKLNVTWAFAEGTLDGEYGGLLSVGPKEVPDLISVPITVYLDSKAPKLKTPMPPSGTQTRYHQPLISLSYSDASGVDFDNSKVYLNGQDISNTVNFMEDGFTYLPEKPLAEGLHHVDVNITDIANNTARKSWSFLVDRTAPSIELDRPFSDRRVKYTREDHVMISGSLDYNVVKLEANVETDTDRYTREITISNKEFQYRQELPEDGQYIVAITATDISGNQRTIPLSIFRTENPASINIDRPIITQQYTRKNELIVSGRVEKSTEHGSVQVWVNGVKRPVMADGSFEHTMILNEGENNIVVKSSDEAGNTFWRNRTIVKDTIPPEVDWNYELEGNKLLVTGEVNEDGSRVYINGRSIRLTNNRFEEEVDLRANAMNEISVVVEDAAGNNVESKRYIDLAAEVDNTMTMLFAAVAMVLLLLIGLLVGYKVMPSAFGPKETPVTEEYHEPEEFDEEPREETYEESEGSEEELDEEFEEGEIEPEPEEEVEEEILDEFDEEEELDEEIVEELVGEPEEDIDEDDIVDDIFG